MSRLDEQLDRDFTVIAERMTPSPDAWASIQQRIADREPHQETEIIMLTDNTLTKRRWPLVAAAAAVAAVAVAGIVLVNRGDDQQPADDPEPAPTVAPAPDDPSPGGTALPDEGEIPPGRYAVDALGVPMTFETNTTWTVDAPDDFGFSLRSADGFVAMTRLGSFYDATEANDPATTGLGSISPDDIDSWIAANDVVVDESTVTDIAGRTATYRRVRSPENTGNGLCPTDERACLYVGSRSADLVAEVPAPGAGIDRDLPHSFWIVELGDFEPVGIWAYTETDHQAFLDELAPLLGSIEFGEPAPAVEGGTARLSTFGANATGDLPGAGQQVVPGTYTTDAVGVPVTLDLVDGQTAPWTLMSNDQTGIQLISDDTGREFIAIGRIGSWFDFDEARTEGTRGLGSIPADGVDTWIETNGVIVVDSAELQVGGRDAKYRLIRLDTTPGATADWCPAGEAPCLWAVSGSADLVDADSTPVPFGRDRVQAVWTVDMGEFEPLFIFAAANLDDDGPWFTDIVQPIVDSIEFGAPAPVIPGGTARVPVRVTVSAPFSGTRTDGEQNPDGSTSITYAATSDGAATGNITGTGSSIPGPPTIGHDENTFTGTIEGIGTGSLSWTVDRTGTNPSDLESTSVVTGGTGDFAGATGTVALNLETSDYVGGVDNVTGTNTFGLVIPRSR